MFSRLCAVLMASWFSANAFAYEVNADIRKTILQKLRKSRPDIPYITVEKTPIAQLYKVRVKQGPTLYVTASADYVIVGELFSAQPGQFVSLHEQDYQKDRAMLIAQVDKQSTIIYAAQTNTKAVIHIFTDVDCGFCAKQHTQITALNKQGIEVRYLAYPRTGLYTPSYSKMKAVWCSKTPKLLLPKLQRGEFSEISECETQAVDKHFALANQLGVKGTPTIIFDDGRMISGYKSADKIATLALAPNK